MKKLLTLTLALVLALSLVACNNNSGSTGDDSTNPPDYSLNDHWPADLVPDLPEYPYGKITGFAGPDSDDCVTIKAGETGQEDLDKYLQTLEDAGWTVNKGNSAYDTDYARAVKGAYAVDFQLQSDTYVQIDVTVAAIGGWPSFDEYPINTVKPEGYEIVDVDVRYYPEDIDEATNSVGSFVFTCVDMDIIAAEEYYQSLQEGGYFETFEWQGHKYYCVTSEDQMQPEGENMYFYFEMYLAD